MIPSKVNTNGRAFSSCPSIEIAHDCEWRHHMAPTDAKQCNKAKTGLGIMGGLGAAATGAKYGVHLGKFGGIGGAVLGAVGGALVGIVAGEVFSPGCKEKKGKP